MQVPGPRGTVARTGNAVLGAQEFESVCRSCHFGHTGRGIFFFSTSDTTGGIFLNPPKWQNFYRRDGLYFNDATASTAGFGFRHDGTLDSSHNNMRTDNMMAFMYAFNGSFPYTPGGLSANNVAVDSHAAVGKQVTLTAAAPTSPLLDQLVALANNQAISLVASACLKNEQRGYAWSGNGQFQSDRAGDSVSVAGLRALAAAGTPVTITAVRGGTQGRIGIDQEQDGVLDGTAGATPQRACTSLSNLALGKVATQSSTAFGGNASRAVDGSSDGNWADNSVTHTAAASAQDWWQVDLGQSSSIQSVTLFNRTDCCSDRLSNFVVFASASDMSGRTLAQLQADTSVVKVSVGSLNGAASINLPLVATARYVKVQLTGTNNLSLAEVQVIGSPAATPVNTNVALGKAATQSSTVVGGVPSRAVDGSTDGNWANNSVTHTAGTAAQDWWQVDLGQAYTVDTVQLFNRTDCCADRLSNFYVLASPTDMTGRTLAQLLADSTVRQIQVASLNGAPNLSVALGGFSARYVRVQLAGTNNLSLAEVQVLGR